MSRRTKMSRRTPIIMCLDGPPARTLGLAPLFAGPPVTGNGTGYLFTGVSNHDRGDVDVDVVVDDARIAVDDSTVEVAESADLLIERLYGFYGDMLSMYDHAGVVVGETVGSEAVANGIPVLVPTFLCIADVHDDGRGADDASVRDYVEWFVSNTAAQEGILVQPVGLSCVAGSSLMGEGGGYETDFQAILACDAARVVCAGASAVGERGDKITDREGIPAGHPTSLVCDSPTRTVGRKTGRGAGLLSKRTIASRRFAGAAAFRGDCS